MGCVLIVVLNLGNNVLLLAEGGDPSAVRGYGMHFLQLTGEGGSLK